MADNIEIKFFSIFEKKSGGYEMKLKSILAGLVAFVSIGTVLTACSDDESVVLSDAFLIDTKSFTGKDFSCVVKIYEDKVVQSISIADSLNGQSGMVVNDNGTVTAFVDEKFENLSESEQDDICEELSDREDDYDKGSFVCGDGIAKFSMTVPQQFANSLSSIASEMEAECKDFLKEWENHLSEGDFSSSNSWNAQSSSSTDTPIIPFTGYAAANEKIEKDENSVYYENFAIFAMLYPDVEQSADYAMVMNPGDSQGLGFDMTEDMEQGTLEFFFRPHANFEDKARMLVGNDGSRLLVYYDSGNLVFMMNRPNEFGFLKASARISSDWNFVRAEWDGSSIYLFLNNELIGEENIGHGYVASDRSGENKILIGYKSSCCMSGAGRTSEMYSDADIGPIRISKILRSRN